ncbi:post-GPI attachment to proteins factor 6-like [Oppia nitens]|uniref:post-GPI attachment to proteins factor 6-like n=1 Tax=Oppia nitens TaxID=1686743 RepID=UPI0023DAAB45|nr:post-GPI attachment to proteins factor 6-like [Oppia nitens]
MGHYSRPSSPHRWSSPVIYWSLMVVIIGLIIQSSQQLKVNQFEASRQLYPLKSYREVQIYHFVIPNEVLEAKWRFNASTSDASTYKSPLKVYSSQLKVLNLHSCEPMDLTVHIRYGSLPIININNATLPENLMTNDTQQYKIEWKSDSTLNEFNITNPLPGHWFALSYINTKDDRISQKGLEVECQHKLTTSLSFKIFSHLFPNNEIKVLTTTNSLIQTTNVTNFYKFYLKANCFSAKLVISECAQVLPNTNRSATLCPFSLYVRSMAMPSHKDNDYLVDCLQSHNSGDNCLIEMHSLASDSWIYVWIDSSNVDTNQQILFKIQLFIDQNTNCFLMNNQLQTNPTLLSDIITYSSRPTSDNKTTDMFINPPNIDKKYKYISLTRYDTTNSLEFKYSHVDATNLFSNQSVSLFMDIPTDNRSVFEFAIIPLADIGGTLAIDIAISPYINITYQNYSMTACLQYGRIGGIARNGLTDWKECFRTMKVNTSSPQFSAGKGIDTVLIPFPKPGNWFLTLEIQCYLNEEYGVEIDCSDNKTSILLDITSTPCLNSKCSNRGKCYQYFSGGVLFSSCVCKGGWKGWFCNDGSQALQEDQLLLNFLLLTLSNVMFIPAVIVATYRKHFTEALIYLTTMTSSMLYHACDSDYPQSYCLLPVNVLQFGDFYSAILAFWVTLITLANMPDLCRAFFHVFGAILIAFAVETDRTSLLAFALPAGIGAAILIIAWVFRCCKTSCYPPSRLWLFSILPGIALSAGGLVVYAFFETQENYAITHSCWHGIMALALLFLVPSMRTDTEDEEVGGKVSMPNAKLAHVEWRPSHTSFKFLNDDIDML